VKFDLEMSLLTVLLMINTIASLFFIYIVLVVFYIGKWNTINN